MQQPTISTKDGLLFRNGVLIPLPEADEVAALHGYTCAERMVKALENMQQSAQGDRLGLPSASGMDRVIRCPGSIAAERGLPEPEKLAITESGTAIHEALHTGDEEALGMTEREIKDNLYEMERVALVKWHNDGFLNDNLKTEREKRYWLRDESLSPVASGQPDVIHFGEKSFLLINFKTGYADPTPSELNWQSRTEVVVTWFNHPQMEHARAGIAASRLTSKLDTTDYDRADYERFKREIFHAVWRAQQPDAPRVPGDHCRWCKAKALCRENAVYNMIIASRVPVAPGKPDDMSIIQAIHHLSPAELGFFYARKGSLEVAMEAAKERLLSMSEEELKSAGFQKMQGSQIGTITSDILAFQRLAAILTPEERLQCIKIVRGRAVELYSEHVVEGKHPTQKASKAAVEAALGDVLVFREGNPKLKAI